MDSLPDGGPLSITIDRRGIDIGRDSYLDWTLPDPSRFVSGKHCEVRYRDGGYWLHDVSTNGTTVNEAPGRLTEPHLLKDGDRIHIGDYIVVAELDGGGGEPAAPVSQGQATPGADPWGGFDNVAESVSKRDFVAASAPSAGSASGRPVLGDVTEEEFSWSIGEVDTPDAADLDADWAAPRRTPERPAVPAPVPGEDEQALELFAAPEPPKAPPAPPRQGKLAEQWKGEVPPAPPPVAAPSPPADAASPAPAQPAAPAGSAGGWVSAFERGAGLPPGSVARSRGDEALAEEIGQLVRIVTENLKSMLAARDETKNAMRSSQRTMIQAMENNPLKFSPTPEDAMRIMFGEKVRSYLDARQTVEASFNDLKAHQMMTFTAMQQALQALIEDLDPEKISGATASDGGLAGLVSSRRAKLWDTYAERYKAKAGRHERGMIDAFMILFAEMYDRHGRR